MSRSLKKGPYINEKLLKKINSMSANDKTMVKTWDRASVITPEMVGRHIGVYNGKTHVDVLIVENMVGHRLGEFSFTRRFPGHGGKMAKDQLKEGTAAPAAPVAAAKPAAAK